MMEQSEDVTGKRTPVTLADGGYHTVANLEAGKKRNQTLVMTERYRGELKGSYFKDNFIFDSATDSYICPDGQRLPFRGLRLDKVTGLRTMRVYRASRTACRTCPAFGICTRDKHAGKALWINASDELLQQHRQWMKTDEALALYARRKVMSEPTFGILKDQMNARKFLLRGLINVNAEFTLLATAFNLRTLWRIWSLSRRTSHKVKTKFAENLATTIHFHGFFWRYHWASFISSFV